MHYVQVVQFEDELVVKQLGPFSENRADRVDTGMNINLNHEEFYTRVVDESEKVDVVEVL